jgi:GT2 family glycosyltransferase
LIDYLYDYSRRTGRLEFFTSNNLALPTDRFRALGGFDASWRFAAGEDRDLCDRWRHAGGVLVHAPEAVIVHRHLLDMRRFWRQHFNYGRGAHHFHRARARDERGRHEVEPWRFYTGLLAYPFKHEPAGRALRVAALLGLSQVANTLGFLSERRRDMTTQETTGPPPG